MELLITLTKCLQITNKEKYILLGLLNESWVDDIITKAKLKEFNFMQENRTKRIKTILIKTHDFTLGYPGQPVNTLLFPWEVYNGQVIEYHNGIEFVPNQNHCACPDHPSHNGTLRSRQTAKCKRCRKPRYLSLNL